MTARILSIALAAVALAACAGGDKPIGPYDSGIVVIPDLGRACAYHDAGMRDFGAIPDFGTIQAPDLSVPPPDLGPPTIDLINGCPSLPACLAVEHTDAGLTYDNFATHVFSAYCVRCHGTAVVDPDRHGAPNGYNWDDRASVNAHLPELRDVLGVSNYMPFDRPTDLSCDLRRGMVTWIDEGAP